MDLAEEYFEELLKKKIAKKGAVSRRRLVRRFMQFFNEHSSKDFREVDGEYVNGFIKSLGTLTVMTVKGYTDILRNYLFFLSKKKGLPVGFCLDVPEKPDVIESFPPDFRKYYIEYLAKKKAENCPFNSFKKMTQSIQKFYHYLSDERGVTELMRVNREDIREYTGYLSGLTDAKGAPWYGPSSVSRYLSDIKTYLLWLSKKGVCHGLASEVRQVRREERLSRNILTRKELVKLFNVKAETPVEFMAKTIFVILYATGVRISELLALRMENIDWENKEFLIYESKTMKERKVFMGEAGKEYLKLFIGSVREKVCYGKALENYAFTSMRDGSMVTNGTVNIHLKEFCRRAGIRKKVTCHSFRHSFGTHLLENGVPLKMVSELLGHYSLSSTEKYTHLHPEQLRQTIMKYHPRERESRE